MKVADLSNQTDKFCSWLGWAFTKILKVWFAYGSGVWIPGERGINYKTGLQVIWRAKQFYRTYYLSQNNMSHTVPPQLFFTWIRYSSIPWILFRSATLTMQIWTLWTTGQYCNSKWHFLNQSRGRIINVFQYYIDQYCTWASCSKTSGRILSKTSASFTYFFFFILIWCIWKTTITIIIKT